MRRSWIVAVLVLIVCAVWLGSSGLLGPLSDRARVVELLTARGPLGPLLFIGLIVALFPVFLVGPPIWSAASVWPALPAIVYSSAGCILASALFYGLARRLGRDWAQQRIPANVRRYEQRLVEHPLRTMLLLRVLLWANPAVDLLIGVTRVTTRDYLIATVAGLVPVTAFHVLVVSRGFRLAWALPGWLWLATAAAVGAALVVRGHRRRRRLGAPAPEA